MHTELSWADATIMTLALGEIKIGACHIFTKCGVKVTTRGEQFRSRSLNILWRCRLSRCYKQMSRAQLCESIMLHNAHTYTYCYIHM